MKRVLVVLVGLAVVALAAAPAAAITVYLTTTGNATLDGLSFNAGDVVAYDTVTETAALAFSRNNFRTTSGATGATGVNIDALHVFANGNILLSTDAVARLGSNVLKFTDGDLVLYNPATDIASLVFSESKFRTAGGALGADEDVDAVYALSDGTLILSTRGDARLGGNLLSFKSGDLVSYDPVSDLASLFLDGSNVFRKNVSGYPTGADENIDGFSLAPGGGLLLSTAANAFIGTPVMQIKAGDIVLYNPSNDSASVFLSYDTFVNKCGTENIDGLSVIATGNPLGVIPEPLTASALVIGAAGLIRYLRRRSA